MAEEDAAIAGNAMTIEGYTTTGPIADRIFDQWPSDVPRPTEEEFLAAEARWNEQTIKAYQGGYSGDFGYNFCFTLRSYSRWMWWHFFFPEQRMEPPSV